MDYEIKALLWSTDKSLNKNTKYAYECNQKIQSHYLHLTAYCNWDSKTNPKIFSLVLQKRFLSVQTLYER